MTQQLMFDTNIFNAIVDGVCDLNRFRKFEIYSTHIQLRELSATKKSDRRKELLEIFRLAATTRGSTKTAVWNDTAWDESEWSADNGVYAALVKRIAELDKAHGKKSSDINISRDARISEVAITDGLVLVTNDSSLRVATAELGGQAKTLSDF